MDTTKTLIERLRAHLGGASNYRLAKHLGVANSAVVRYVHQRGGMSYEIGMRLASELDLQPDYVLLCLAAEREQAPEIRTRWQKLAHQASGQTAPRERRTRRAANVATVLLATGIAALGALAPRPASAGGAHGLYIMASRRVDRFRPRIGRPRRTPRRRPLQQPAPLPITATL